MYRRFLSLLKKKTDKVEMLDISFIISFFAHLFLLFAILVKSFNLEKAVYDSSSIVVQIDADNPIGIKKVENESGSGQDLAQKQISERLQVITTQSDVRHSMQDAAQPNKHERRKKIEKVQEKPIEKKAEKSVNKEAEQKVSKAQEQKRSKPVSSKTAARSTKSIKENSAVHTKMVEKKDTKLSQEKMDNKKQSIIDEILNDSTLNASGMTGDEVEAIRSQIRSVWNPVIFGTVDNIMYVKVVIKLAEDGSVIAIRNIPTQSNNTGYSAFLDSVIMAIANASPISGLSPKKFSQWSEIELTFSSEDV